MPLCSLTEEAAAQYAPCERSNSDRGKYDVFVRVGTGPWVFGATCFSATDAVMCMNYVRRTKPRVHVRVTKE